MQAKPKPKLFILDSDGSSVYSLAASVARLGYCYQIQSLHQPLSTLKQALADTQQLSSVIVLIAAGVGHPEQAGVLLEFLQSLAPHKKAQTEQWVPVLGLGLGHQALLYLAGAKLVPCRPLKHGTHTQLVRKPVQNELLDYLTHSFLTQEDLAQADPFKQFQVACYQTFESRTTPTEYAVLATEKESSVASIIHHIYQPWMGFNFNPESILTTQGNLLLASTLQHLANYQTDPRLQQEGEKNGTF